jgi:8-oxo-dGTP diphosphatase
MTSSDDSQWRPARYCSRCGALLGQRTIGGRVRAVCAACGFVAYVDPKVACAVLVEEAGRVLLVRRRHEPGRGLWCLPAGFADADEAPDTAARREAREEAGVEVVVDELLGAYHYTDDPRGAGILLVYRARRVDSGPPAAGDDADDVGFFEPGALPPISHHTHRTALAEWVALMGRRARR